MGGRQHADFPSEEISSRSDFTLLSCGEEPCSFSPHIESLDLISLRLGNLWTCLSSWTCLINPILKKLVRWFGVRDKNTRF
jgi:hypothetical protein